MATKKKKGPVGHIVAQNRKARRDYHIEEVFEAGLELMGSEVKSLRSGRGSIQGSYATEQDGEIWLINAHVPEYASANPQFAHQPRRPRKLLLHRREIEKLIGAVQRQGYTLIPLSVFFNPRGFAKLELALATGKQNIDKRQDVKKRDWDRQKARLLRAKG